MKTCPWCGHPEGGQILGVLGLLTWFRCRYCGGQFSKTVKRRASK